MLPSLPELQKERGFPFTLPRKKKLLKFKRESTCFKAHIPHCFAVNCLATDARPRTLNVRTPNAVP